MTTTMLKVETDSGQAIEIPQVLPIVPLRELVVFPQMMFPLVVSRPGLMALADEALAGSKMIGLFTLQPNDAEELASATGASMGDEEPDDDLEAEGEELPEDRELVGIGTVAVIHKMLRFPDGGMRLLVQGVNRVRLVETVQEKPFLKGRVEVVPTRKSPSRRTEALRRNALELFQRLVDATGYLPEELKVVGLNIEDPGRLADFLAANLNIKLPEKLVLLGESDADRRLEEATRFMVRELDILDLGKRIQGEVQGEMERSQREFYLRQQIKAIQRELGGGEDGNPDIEEIERAILEANLPEVALAAVTKESERLKRIPPQAAEYSIAKTYIDWMLQVPWSPVERPSIDVDHAEEVLNEDHYDLETVKERILEYLAVRKLTDYSRSPILCLTGPPGVGKTSLGRSIARALDRPFVRLALGGLHDEAEIRGHRRTYIGAMPGRVVQGIVNAKAPDPVFMLDEIDKVGNDFRGDPTSALLEVLDPAQNDSFHDNYLNVPVDLSRVLFVTTANSLYTIPAPLRDRMEVIELSGYTTREKVEIAKRYLVPRALEENGITAAQLKFTASALSAIASQYTREAGVRNLGREISRVARKVATRVARGKRVKVSVSGKNLAEYLGRPRVHHEGRGRKDRKGIVTGLAWTPFGGEILFVEATQMKGRGGLTLTGQLGDVMRESAQAALSWVRTHLEDLSGSTTALDGQDVHIHVPAGAMPKDGPSAGVAMVTALVSLVADRPVRSDTAMTGEISLRGAVLPIGGVKQKVLGARRAGIKRILLPEANGPDLEDVPDEVRDEMEFVLVKDIKSVLEAALRPARRKGRA